MSSEAEHELRELLAQQREQVETTLVNENMLHGTAEPEPAWFHAPQVSVWRVREGIRGRVWLWGIAGDLPCDYIGVGEASDARAALFVFATRWTEIANAISIGEPPPFDVIGFPDDWTAVSSVALRARANLLHQWAQDDALWHATG